MKCHQLPLATASFKEEGDVTEEESVRLMWNVGLYSAQNTDAKTRFLSGAVEHTFEKAARTPPLWHQAIKHSVQLQKVVLNMGLKPDDDEKHNQNLVLDVPHQLTWTKNIAHHIVIRFFDLLASFWIPGV